MCRPLGQFQLFEDPGGQIQGGEGGQDGEPAPLRLSGGAGVGGAVRRRVLDGEVHAVDGLEAASAQQSGGSGREGSGDGRRGGAQLVAVQSLAGLGQGPFAGRHAPVEPPGMVRENPPQGKVFPQALHGPEGQGHGGGEFPDAPPFARDVAEEVAEAFEQGNGGAGRGRGKAENVHGRYLYCPLDGDATVW